VSPVAFKNDLDFRVNLFKQKSIKF